MANGSAPSAAQRRITTQRDKAQTQIQERAAKVPQQSRRGLCLQSNPLRTMSESVQEERQKRPREDEAPLYRPPPEPTPKRARTSVCPEPFGRKAGSTISDVRVDHWRNKGSWPTEEQERNMQRFQEATLHHVLAKKRSSNSLRRKRSEQSSIADTALTPTASDQRPRGEKSAPYRHPRYEGQLRERGSFMDNHEEGITAQSRELCQKLLKAPQPLPEHTLFSDDKLFKKTCERIRGENETKVVRDVAQLIVPPAEILADREELKHLEILRETTNAGWTNAIPFYGPHPQPDYGLGFKREAFDQERLRKLQPFIGNELEDCSCVAATYNMYFPFLTSEVKCGASALDIADRQNAHSQTVIVRNLVEIFRLVGREEELHREIVGFSISHSDVDVRIWGHYAFIDGRDATFYRHPIGDFSIKDTELDRARRWTAYTFIRNAYDLWLPDHYKRICSVIDMLPPDLNLEVSELSELQSQDQGLGSIRSGLSQHLEDHSLADDQLTPGNHQITPETTILTETNDGERRKKAKK